MWKNTNGVYTADPRRVPEAFSIDSVKYDEALGLAYLGAQVFRIFVTLLYLLKSLSHRVISKPAGICNTQIRLLWFLAFDDIIPVYVRNIFNLAFEGTVVQGCCPTLKETAGTILVVSLWLMWCRDAHSSLGHHSHQGYHTSG